MFIVLLQQLNDVQNLLTIFQSSSSSASPSFDNSLRLAAAEQLCLVLMDERFAPLLAERSLQRTVAQQLELAAAVTTPSFSSRSPSAVSAPATADGDASESSEQQ